MPLVDGQLVSDFVSALGFEPSTVSDIHITPSMVKVTHVARDETGRRLSASFVSYLPIEWPSAKDSQDSE